VAINGFSVCQPSDWAAYTVPGTTRRLLVRREVAPLLMKFAGEFHRLVEPITINPLDDWGAVCRKVRGRNLPSFHSAGIAIDLNATRHPLGRVGTFNPRQRATIRALCRKYGLRWGGDYRGRKDEMHFEVILPRPAALALVHRLQAKPAPAPAAAKTVSPPRLAKLTFGTTSADVVKLQQRLRTLGFDPGPADGNFGPATRRAVVAFQRSDATLRGDADGIVGPATLGRLW
jgi:hypothetical protein